MELEDGSGVYTTSTCNYGKADDEEEENEMNWKGEARKDRLPLQHSSTHIVKLSLMWCSCGVWQDTLLPYRRACAKFCKAKLADKNYILANLIDVYYTHGCVQATFKRKNLPGKLRYIGLQRWNTTYPGYHLLCPSAKNKTRQRTKRICGVRGFADIMFKLWSSRSQQENLFWKNKRHQAGFKKGWTKYKRHYWIKVGTVSRKSLFVIKRYEV